MQYCQIEKIVNILKSIQDQPINNIINSLTILELYENLATLETRRLSFVNKLIEQYGTLNENGIFEIKPDNPNFFDFLNKYNELQTVDTNIVLPEGFSLNIFDGYKLTLQQLKILKELTI